MALRFLEGEPEASSFWDRSVRLLALAKEVSVVGVEWGMTFFCNWGKKEQKNNHKTP